MRLTVDVSPADHAALRRLCVEMTELAGESVSGQDVLRALLQAVLYDPGARHYLSRSVGQ